MKIATWNINGINSRLDHVLRWSETAQPDVLCLQETKVVDAKFPVARLQAVGYEHCAFFGEKAYNGVAILSRSPLENIVYNFPDDYTSASNRLIAATTHGIRIVNVYAPHGTSLSSDKFKFKLDWFARLRAYFEAVYTLADPIVLCGDLNIAPHPIDVWNVAHWKDRMHFTKPERDAIADLKRWGFVDVIRQFNDEPGEYSWWDIFRESSFTKNRGLRIDHIWTSPPLADACLDAWIDREPRGWEKPSDHAPVLATFNP